MDEHEKDGKPLLTPKQERLIQNVARSRTIEEACRLTGINKSLYYKWCKVESFASALKEYRRMAAKEALDRLEKGLDRAVEVLIALLGSENESIRRYAANDVIGHVLKARELRELDERLTSIERLVLEKRTYRR